MSYDAMVSELTALGVPLEKATARAATEYPEAARALDVAAVRRANVLEKDEQCAITKMARAIGMTVRSTSQARASKVAPGLPDLILSHAERGFFGFWETKRARGGVRSASQLEFSVDCAAASVAYGYGDRYDFAHWLAYHRFTIPPIPQD